MSNKYSDQGRVVERRGCDTQIFTDAAVNFLRARDQARPFFLFIGYAATHNPWINRPERLVSHYRRASFRDIPEDISYPFGRPGTHPAAPQDPREALAQYYASVTMIDEGLGRVLDELDAQSARDETLVVYTSDHGLNMGHHGIWGKGNGSEPLNMLEESIRVPLILNQPSAIDGGQSRTEFVNHCDLHATLMDIAQAGPCDPSSSPGRSYKPVLKGEGLDWTNHYIGEYGTVRAIRDERYKLVLRQDCDENQLIDLRDDPRETVNLYTDKAQRELREEMETQLKAFFAQYEAPKHSGLLGDELPIHNRREAWRTRRASL
ncbi:MAG: sulfatase-like hydrolase/transferase [Chloroflexi bacterium]|nr:sulfatase-like hydrolase/transferase [Chloroflexota bacterium]